jgi:hypothetical protein
MSDEAKNDAEKKPREPKKNSIPSTEIEALTNGIPQYKKTSFLVVGHRDGVRIALPLTAGVSRAYFYGNGDYSLIPQHDAITVFTEEQRKEQRRGGIMAEVDFEKGLDAAREALTKLIEVVRAAPAPAPKALAKPKEPRKAKAVPVVKELALDDGESCANEDDINDGAVTAEA